MLIKRLSAFTLIEMLLVFLILNILLMITLSSKPLQNTYMIEDELNLKQFITQLHYYKSLAIKERHSVTLLFANNTNRIKVIQPQKKSEYYILYSGKIISISNLKQLSFDKNGNVDHFGNLIIKYPHSTYKLIFHIEKGRLRYEKL